MGGVTKPSVGRIVHYKSRGSADGKFPSVARAAIITDVRQGEQTQHEEDGKVVYIDHYEVKVTVFNPEGMFFTDWLEQGDAPGNWNWPPMV